MRRPAAVILALVLAAAVQAPAAARAGKHHRHRAGRTPDKKSADAAGGAAGTPSARNAAGTALLRLIQPQLDDMRACYTRERAKNPRLSAAEVVVHAIVDASGKIIESVPYGVKAKPDSFAVIQHDVARCVSKRVGALVGLGSFPDGMARKVVVVFRFGSDAPGASQALDGSSMEQVHLALSVVSGQSVGFARSISQLSHRYCWKVDDREGCSLRVLNLFPSVRLKKEVPIFKPGDALTDSDRSRLETRVLRDLTGDDTFRWPPGTELPPTEWPDDAAAVVLPDVGLALSAAAGHVDIGQATADGEEIPSPRLDLPGGRAVHMVAVYWAATVPVVGLGIRRPAAANLGDPAQSTRVTDVQVIRLGK